MAAYAVVAMLLFGSIAAGMAMSSAPGTAMGASDLQALRLASR